MIFRRPELEKDNPLAPEPYVGPRRRLAMARAAALGRSTEDRDMKETLQTLVETATRFLNEQPNVRRPGKSLTLLQDAIAQAKRVLTEEKPLRTSRKVRR